jgi:molybdate transport system ATP-binding protein
METNLLFFKDVQVKIGAQVILKELNISLSPFQHTAIIGTSGSGKTVLANTILGKHFFSGEKISPDYSQIVFVGQQHLFADFTNTRTNLYYQQRFQSSEQETTSTVAAYLMIDELLARHPFLKDWLKILSIEPLLEKNLIQLSNGENKRVQIFKSLINQPKLIIFDQPFIGLDPATRALLADSFEQLSQYGITYLLLTSSTELPQSIKQVYILTEGRISTPVTKSDFETNTLRYYSPKASQEWNLSDISFEKKHPPFNEYVKISNCSVRYGDKYLLKDVSFTVLPHTAWCVYGHNGAGKSTLLSLISADHPQAYANEVYLFDRKRGTGESIWDIKKNIGFISPELHLYFEPSATCQEAVASGLFDTIGLFRKLNNEQVILVEKWLKILNLGHLSNKRLNTCSTGEQRLVLLARACIKQPPLLILDEPCQGLDEQQTQHINDLIDAIYNQSNMSFLYVTHYHQQVPKCIQYYLKLEKGIATIHA